MSMDDDDYADFVMPVGEQMVLDHLPVWDSAYMYAAQPGASRRFREPREHERAIAWLGPTERAHELIGATRALTDAQMRATCRVVELGDEEPSLLDVLTIAFSSLARGKKSAGLGRPSPVALGVLQRFVEPAIKFPVYVNYPGFGMARVFRYVCVRQKVGFGEPLLYYAVKKLTPDKTQPGGRFSQGYWAVPAGMITRIKLAAEAISAADNRVQLFDDEGRAYPPMDLDTFRRVQSPEYEMAREMVVAQYPLTDWAEFFATQPTDVFPQPLAGFKAFPAPPPELTAAPTETPAADAGAGASA